MTGVFRHLVSSPCNQQLQLLHIASYTDSFPLGLLREVWGADVLKEFTNRHYQFTCYHMNFKYSLQYSTEKQELRVSKRSWQI